MQTRLAAFQNYLLAWYQRYGRHTLPWRLTTDPYSILVSELMLQQTQVERVVPKYLAFLQQFPDVGTLAAVPLSQVLAAWQGLGYNRRAKFLWQLAQQVSQQMKGVLPSDLTALQQLPGIGPYTAAAVMAFAYNASVPLIETNVRAVFMYHFFPGVVGVTDQQIMPLVAESLPDQQSRIWYWALMDYGSHLKSVLPNPSRHSKQHHLQKKFQGSLRQIRGEIVRLLVQAQHQGELLVSVEELGRRLKQLDERFVVALEQLVVEGLVVREEKKVQLG